MVKALEAETVLDTMRRAIRTLPRFINKFVSRVVLPLSSHVSPNREQYELNDHQVMT